MKNIILFCLLIVSGISYGGQWKIYATANEGTIISTYDKDTLKEIKPKIIKVWTNTTDLDLAENTKTNNYIDCKRETINHADVYVYKDGKLINSATDYKGIMSPPPDSVGWLLIQTVCKAP